MKIQHKVEAARWSPRKVAQRFLNQGRAMALGIQEKGGYAGFCRIPFWMVRELVVLKLKMAAAFLSGQKDQALWNWLESHLYQGAVWYCFQDWLTHQPQTQARPRVAFDEPQ